MALESYISELLYRYDCVVLPGFGAFLTQIRPARIDETTHTAFPPTKTLAFNTQLTTNDGLLASYMGEVENATFEAMLETVHGIVEDWKIRLQNKERITLDGIGELWSNPEGKIQFQPSREINYLTSAFGLSSFGASKITREILKENVVELEQKAPFAFTPEKRKNKALRPYLHYAAVLLLAFATGLTGFQAYQKLQNNRQMAQQEAYELVSKQIQEATFFGNRPVELPTITLKVTSKTPSSIHQKGMHHIIAGAFRFRTNADKKIAQLQHLGYPAAYLGTNPFGLHMVTYSSHANSQEALKALKKVRRTHSKDAWLKSVK
ncbi:MAG: SPOR domain-containing protein [Bacteroidota bacterium]